MAEVTPLTLDDYDAIADAVQETERGRWFLAEYARRNRAADTAAVLDALAGLERRLSLQGPASSAVVGLVHEALERAMLARAASPAEAPEKFDALERTLRRAAVELGSPAPEREASASIASNSAAPHMLALAAPLVVDAVAVGQVGAAEEAGHEAYEVSGAADEEPVAAPSLAHDEGEPEPQPSSVVAAPSAIERTPAALPEVATRSPERPTPSLTPARSTLLLDSLSAAEKAILFA